METRIQDLAELKTEAERLVRGLIPQSGRATLITLAGELGAGKTALTKAIATALGVRETVNSPTFVLEKIYLLPKELGSEASKFQRLVHIDAYRLEKGADLSAIGFDEVMSDAGNLVILEWPERVKDTLPKSDFGIALNVLPDGTRHLTYV